jgi:hypothetical protein
VTLAFRSTHMSNHTRNGDPCKAARICFTASAATSECAEVPGADIGARASSPTLRNSTSGFSCKVSLSSFREALIKPAFFARRSR